MNKLYLLLLGFCLLIVQPVMAEESDTDDFGAPSEEKVSPADAREEAKAAAAWLKEHMAMRKKVLSALKKVKNEKSAAKAAKALNKLTGKDNVGKKTALGEVGDSLFERPFGRPDTAAMDALLKKNIKRIDKSTKDIEEEVDRIESLDLEDTEFLNVVSDLLSAAIASSSDFSGGDDEEEDE